MTLRTFAHNALERVRSTPVPQSFRPQRTDSVWRWVCPRQVALDIDAPNKREALAAIASLCAESHNLAPAPLLRALWRRERAGSTALGDGVAIPHARIDGIDHPLTLFARTRIPIDFHAPDRRPVSDLYAILVPMKSDCEAHLELLAKVAEMLSDPELRKRVAAASTSAVAHSVFAQWVAHHKNNDRAASDGHT
jgi:PTS system nitrogen regulatory IIA component